MCVHETAPGVMNNEAAVWKAMEDGYGESPIHGALGLSLRVVGRGVVEIHYHGSDSAANRHGVVGGGALAAMVDSAVMQACRTTFESGDQAVTLELKTNYLKPAPKGQPLVATGTVEHSGRRTAVGTARVLDEAGDLVALGTVTISIRRSAAAAQPEERS